MLVLYWSCHLPLLNFPTYYYIFVETQKYIQPKIYLNITYWWINTNSFCTHTHTHTSKQMNLEGDAIPSENIQIWHKNQCTASFPEPLFCRLRFYRTQNCWQGLITLNHLQEFSTDVQHSKKDCAELAQGMLKLTIIFMPAANLNAIMALCIWSRHKNIHSSKCHSYRAHSALI